MERWLRTEVSNLGIISTGAVCVYVLGGESARPSGWQSESLWRSDTGGASWWTPPGFKEAVFGHKSKPKQPCASDKLSEQVPLIDDARCCGRAGVGG